MLITLNHQFEYPHTINSTCRIHIRRKIHIRGTATTRRWTASVPASDEVDLQRPRLAPYQHNAHICIGAVCMPCSRL